jgi:hypothetical protein
VPGGLSGKLLLGGLSGELLPGPAGEGEDAGLEGEDTWLEGKTVVKAVEVTVAVVSVLMIVGAFVTVSIKPDVIVATVLLVTEVMMR